MRAWIAAGLGAGTALLATAQAAPQTDTTHLTLYQGAAALVVAETTVEAPAGGGEVPLAGLPEGLQLGTLDVRGADSGAVASVRAQSPRPLLAGWLGREVTLLGPGDERRSATLEAVENGTSVVAVDGRLELLGPGSPWRLALPLEAAPERGRIRVRLADGGGQALALTYLTGGLDWRADYTLRLTGEDATLSGAATLRNHSGADYDAAGVSLVAGAVQDPGGNGPAPVQREMRAMAADAASSAEPAADWHRYRLDGEYTLGDGERLRVPLLAPAAVTVTRSYQVTGHAARRQSGSESQPVKVRLAVTPPEGNERPLPAGSVRVIDTSGASPLYQGGDRIRHTPAGEGFELALGEAFDLRAQREQTAYERLGERRFEMAWRIRLTNAGETARTVAVTERLPGDWQITQASDEPAGRGAHSATWQLRVPADGETVLRYRARIEQ